MDHFLYCLFAYQTRNSNKIKTRHRLNEQLIAMLLTKNSRLDSRAAAISQISARLTQ